MRIRRLFKPSPTDDTMLGRLMEYGGRDKGLDTALVTLFVLAVNLLFVSNSGVLADKQTLEQVVSSDIVSEFSLMVFRLSCLLLVIVTLAWLVLDPEGATDHPLYFEERKVMPRKVVGAIRLAAFTQWHFALIGVSFAVSSLASWIHYRGGDVPDWILLASPILFSTSYSCAILVTCVITFHIIGDEIDKEHNIDHLFSWYEIVMHNANVGMMGLALLLNGIEVDLRYLAFPIIFGIIYVTWAAIFANFIGGVFIYDFIDYRKSGAPLIYVILLLVLTIFFFIVLGLDRISEWSHNLAIVLVIVLTWSISTLSNPSQG